MHRSHTDKTILLLKIEDKYVPIAEQAVHIMSQVAQQYITVGAAISLPCALSSSGRMILKYLYLLLYYILHNSLI
jgi:hypothetical protein